MTTIVKILMICKQCGQRNRVIVDTVSNCGACGRQLTGFVETLGTLSDRLHAADAHQKFGRMHFPEEYVVCAGCGCTYHKDHDATNHARCMAARS
jgi:hypothetical protein